MSLLGDVWHAPVARVARLESLAFLLMPLWQGLYAFYSWLLWPTLIGPAARQLVQRRDWTKTEREPLAPEPLSQ